MKKPKAKQDDAGHTENADFNAAKVIRGRGVNHVLSGEYREKVSKKTMRMAKKQSNPVGADRSNRDSETSQKPVETSVSHPAGNGQMLGSQKQEGMAVRPAEPPLQASGYSGGSDHS